MAGRQTPPVRARQLAKELRLLRTRLGLTGEQVSESLGWSTAKVSRIESAFTLISIRDLRRLLALYEVDDVQQQRYLKLAEAARERGWWEVYSDIISEKYAAFIQLEDDASYMSSYRMTLVHGLLQTESYTRSLAHKLPPSQMDRMLEVRRKRQTRLRSFEPLELNVVFDEGVLRRRVGDAATMEAQLRHLMGTATQPNIRIRIIPFENGSPHQLADFSILRFAEPGYPDVVYIEQMGGSLIVEDEVMVLQYADAFADLETRALSHEDSLGFIERLI